MEKWLTTALEKYQKNLYPKLGTLWTKDGLINFKKKNKSLINCKQNTQHVTWMNATL